MDRADGGAGVARGDGLVPVARAGREPLATGVWKLFDLLPVWSVTDMPWGATERLAELFLGLGWRDASPSDGGSPSLAVPHVLDALAKLDAAAVDAVEESSRRAQLARSDSKLTRKSAVVDVHPFAGPFKSCPGSIATVALSVGFHVRHQYQLAARHDRSGKSWRDRFADPGRGILVRTNEVDPGLADASWDPLVEPLLESIRRAMAELARTPPPRIRWQVGGEVVWDTARPRWLPPGES